EGKPRIDERKGSKLRDRQFEVQAYHEADEKHHPEEDAVAPEKGVRKGQRVEKGAPARGAGGEQRGKPRGHGFAAPRPPPRKGDHRAEPYGHERRAEQEFHHEHPPARQGQPLEKELRLLAKLGADEELVENETGERSEAAEQKAHALEAAATRPDEI